MSSFRGLRAIISLDVTAKHGERGAGNVVSDGYSNAAHLRRVCVVSHRLGHDLALTLKRYQQSGYHQSRILERSVLR